MIEHSPHSVLDCDIQTARFTLDCSRAAVCPSTLLECAAVHIQRAVVEVQNERQTNILSSFPPSSEMLDWIPMWQLQDIGYANHGCINQMSSKSQYCKR